MIGIQRLESKLYQLWVNLIKFPIHFIVCCLDALGKENVNLQLNILILLRKIHDIGSLDAVLSFFNSQHPELREAAVTTLRYLNQVQICPKALSLLNDADNNVRRATAITLGYLKDGKFLGYSVNQSAMIPTGKSEKRSHIPSQSC